jgi:prepilin signal peptidase PulO-like enzyme (type II secretory pathway)
MLDINVASQVVGGLTYFEIFFALVGLIYLTPIDIKEHKVPNKLLLIGLVLRVVLFIPEIILFFISDAEQVDSYFLGDLIGAAALGLFMLVFSVVSKGGVGMGDVKLVALATLFCGPAIGLWGLLAGSLLNALYSLLQLARKKITRKDSVAMVPFLTVGFVISSILFVGGII